MCHILFERQKHTSHPGQNLWYTFCKIKYVSKDLIDPNSKLEDETKPSFYGSTVYGGFQDPIS